MAEAGNESWLLLLCSIPVIGEWVANIVGLAPLGLVFVLLGDSPGFALIVGGLVLAPWLIFLQRWQRVRMNLPYVPVKWLWLTPLIILAAVACFF